MNKRQREIKTTIREKNVLVDKALADQNTDEAAKLLDEVDALQKEYDLIDRAESAKKLTVTAEEPIKADAEDTVGKSIELMGVKVSSKALTDFAKAFRSGFKSMGLPNEGTGSEGGYTVPEDIVTLIERFRDAEASLRQYVRVINVKTNKGRRTFKARSQQTGFAKVGEKAKLPKKAGPVFSVLEYAIDKFGGWLPVTNELIEDSDNDILASIAEWFGDEARVTENVNILNAIATLDKVEFENFDDVKHAFEVTLGQAFAATAAIITNDVGNYWLGTLKDGQGRYLVQPNPAEPKQPQIFFGARAVPLVVVPCEDMPNEDFYELTTDVALDEGKTYYTRSGSGTSESPYIYTAVASPIVSAIGTYYDKFACVPMIVGDLNEAVALFDRRALTLKMSDTASAGSSDEAVNAFEEDLTLVRGILREDVKIRDAKAAVRGCVVLPA